MTLEQIARKYGVNPNTLNSKDDALRVGVESIKELVKGMEQRNVDKDFVDAIKKLGEFLFETANSTIG
jgi:phage portal protein BeeE